MSESVASSGRETGVFIESKQAMHQQKHQKDAPNLSCVCVCLGTRRPRSFGLFGAKFMLISW